MCPVIPILILSAVGLLGAAYFPLMCLIEEWIENKNKKLKEEIKELKKQISEAEAEIEVLVAEEVERRRPKALTESKVKYIKGLMPQEEKELKKLNSNQIKSKEL